MADEQIKGIFTTKGREQIAEALAGGPTVIVGSMVFGNSGGQQYTPVVSQESLVNQIGSTTAIAKVEGEVWTFFEASVSYNDLDPYATPDKVIREVGLTNISGDLIIVVSVPDINIVNPTGGVSQKVPIRIGLTVTNGEVISVLPDPDSIPPFTQQNLGLIKGRTQDGYVAALDGDSGYGKVYGWEKMLKSSSETPQGVDSDLIFDAGSTLSFVVTDNYYTYTKSGDSKFYAVRPIHVGDIVYTNSSLTSIYGVIYSLTDSQVAISNSVSSSYSYIDFDTDLQIYHYQINGTDYYTNDALASGVVLYTNSALTVPYGTVVSVNSSINNVLIALYSNLVYTGPYSIDTLNLAHVETDGNDTVLKVGNTSSVLQFATNMSEDEEINNHIIVDTFDNDGNPTQKTLMYIEDGKGFETLPYCFYSGNVDSTGVADIINAGVDVSYKVGGLYPKLQGTLLDGTRFIVDGINSDNITGLEDGTYVKYVGENNETDLLHGDFIVSKTLPNNKTYNVNIVGSLTNNSGVLSGFSNSNYARIPILFNPSSSTWEKFIKITTSADVTTDQEVWGCSGYPSGCSLNIWNSKIYVWVSSDNTSWDIANELPSTNTLNANTTYYIKYYFTGSAYKVDVSTTGAFNGEEVNYINITSSTPVASHTIDLGLYSGWNIMHPFFGTIDLNGSYIKINNNIVWKGAIDNPPADNDVWLCNAVYPLTVKKYTHINYDIHGTLLISNDYIVSGFSNDSLDVTEDSFLTLTNIQIPSGNTWEYRMYFNTGNLSNKQDFGGFGTYENKGMNTVLNTNSTISLYLSSNGSTWDICNGNSSSLTLTANTNYYMRRYFTGSAYKIDISTTGLFEGEEVNYLNLPSNTSINSNSMSVDVGCYITSTDDSLLGNPVSGSIDLKELKISVNDSIIWELNNDVVGWHDYTKVPVGKFTISSNNITSVKTFSYNINYLLPLRKASVCIESYMNGSSWYRVYSDGWCEQGGYKSGNGNVECTLLKNYANTEYQVQMTPEYSAFLESAPVVKTGSKITSKFTIITVFQYSFYWQACGYLY